MQALRDFSLSVPEACLFGLLGPNGAGKTTAMRILATLLGPDQGSVEVAGVNALEIPGRSASCSVTWLRRWRSTRS